MISLKEISKHKPEEWLIEHIDACPFFVEASAYGFTMPFPRFEPHYRFTLSYFHDSQLDWITLIKEHDEMGNKIAGIGMRKPDFFPQFFRKWNKGLNEFYEYALDLRNMDFDGLSDKKLSDLFREYYEICKKTHLPGWIDAFIFFADRHFSELIGKYCEGNDIKDVQKTAAVLSAPIEPSFIFESEEELCRISQIKDKAKREKAVGKYLDRFFWLKGSYAGSVDYAREEVLKEIREIKRPEPRHNAQKKEKQELMHRNNFTQEIKSMVRLIEIISKWQDNRKIFTLTHVFIDDKFLRQASRQTGISRDYLRYSSIEEFSGLIEGKMDKRKFEKELIERNRGSFWIYSEGRPQAIITGNDAVGIFESIREEHKHDVAEINGMAASLGKAKGRVSVIRKISDINKVMKGDVLVASMTRPEHTPALKKASAIVTDDGGITCHAAIISRELGIPCIIGTKIATKVLKDGDMVEVNADKGIVRRIR